MPGILVALLATALVGAGSVPVVAQSADAVTGKLKRAGIEEKLGGQVDRSAVLLDANGDAVTFDEYLDGERPVILNFVYHSCPMLCSMVLEATAKAAGRIDWTPGEEYRIVSVSISDSDTPETAARQKARYVERLGKPGAHDGWHFLTGPADQVARVAGSVGFGYEKDEESGEYGHGAALILLSPDGVVTRYLYGINYKPFDLRAGLVEAAEGTVGTVVDRLIMFCFQYDPAEGSYVPEAWLAMRVAGGLTILLLGSLIGFMWIRERRKSARARNRGAGRETVRGTMARPEDDE